MADTCVARVPVFASLSPDDQHRVETLARPTHLHAGETAYSADDDVSQLMVLHTGRLKIFRLSADGSEQLVRVLLPGEFTGEASVFTGQRPDSYATALDESRLCVFRHDDLRALITQHPDIGLRMLAAVSERLSDTERRLGSLTSRGVEGRLADYLLGLPSAWRDGIATVTLPLAKKDVAALLDTTPESFSRALKGLAAQGLIVVGAGRSVSITQPDRLQRLVDVVA
ncbi:Crp/Fnr family transcriptional regulator [Cellulomonas sp. WB94]|uniref:Crp/Fnr family transcriptional regulator n=1 Tax=Cellulomonas sp. WB94 TaxID=2173174 RepID=UPI000D57DE0F|nr:Crp/Fnr family transcriptional regulator [Cellulomonas sp. WB94]PVU82598.1 Crp/Fnr family transcriptional regulator [Cellulomonas sp. WB94]